MIGGLFVVYPGQQRLPLTGRVIAIGLAVSAVERRGAYSFSFVPTTTVYSEKREKR